MIVLIHGAAKMAKINKYSRNERKKVIDNVDEKKKQTLNKIHNHFAVTPIDKANGDIAFVC